MATKAFNITGGELSLVNAALSSTEWEGVLRRLMNESSQLHVRSLKLDDNDLGGERLDAAIGEAIPRLDLLTDLSICDARLAGPATHRLLEALGSVPAFARTHAEVWAPIPTVVQPPQGARLCLMRNSIAAADLTPPGDAPITPLRGVLILALSGNQLLGDGGVVALSTLAPSLRKLYLGKCGVTLGAKGGVPALFERCWPMLEALALYDNPLVQGSGETGSGGGFERLAKSLHERARAVATKRLLPPKPPATVASSSSSSSVGVGGGGLGASSRGGGLGSEPAHPYFHLDVRMVTHLPPKDLSLLSEKMKEYSKEHGDWPWVLAQPFAGGRLKMPDGLVLRHDYEELLTVRLCLKIDEQNPKGDIVLLGDGNEKPFYVEMPDVAMRASLAEVTAAVAAAANVTAKGGGSSGSEHKYKQAQTLEEGANEKRLENAGRHERRLRQTLKEISFPQSKATEHRPFQAVALENMANGDKLPCGLIWQAGGQQADKIAVGSLLHRRGESNAEPPPRHFDASPLGKPTLSEARKLIELTLSLRLQPKPEQGNKSGGASASGAAPSKKQRKA